jgi:hypothetical protein
MFSRSPLRDLVAGVLLTVSLIGLTAGSHAQVAFWKNGSAAGNMPPLERLSERDIKPIVMRTQSPDHVRAQIERMEARARADDRLNGRAAAQRARSDDRVRPSTERDSQANNSRPDERQTHVGPGWQARERDGGR